MQQPPKVLQGVFWLITEKLLRLAATVPVTLLIARSLGPSDFGRLGYALGVAGVALVASQLGLDRLLRRDFAGARELAGVRFKSALLLSGIASLLSAAGLWFFASLTVKDPLTARLLQILSLGVLPQFLLPSEYWFQASGNLSKVTFTKLGALLVCAGLRTGLCLTEARLEWFAAVAALEWSFAAGGVYLLLARSPDAPSGSAPSADTILSWCRESWPLFILALLSACYDRLDILILNHQGNGEQLGYYTAAQRFSELFFVLSSTASASILPWLARHRQVDHHEYQRRLQWYLDASLAAPLLIALGASLLAPWAVTLLFGHDFHASGLVLVLLCWTAPAIYTEVARSQYLVAEHLIQYDALFNLMQALCFAPLAWFLAQRWGAVGIATARLATASLSCWLLPLLFARTRHIGLLQLRAFSFPFRLREPLGMLRRQLALSLSTRPGSPRA